MKYSIRQLQLPLEEENHVSVHLFTFMSFISVLNLLYISLSWLKREKETGTIFECASE
jgi:hypothetical protein